MDATMLPVPDGAQVICCSGDLAEGDRLGFQVLYRGEPLGALLIRFGGAVHGWINRCVRMARPLDSEDADMFDPDEGLMPCSNHGVTYDAATGACRAGLCADNFLTALKIAKRDRQVRLVDRHAEVAP
jgi:nitrite reductase/ring-hydroxylating ferredoxin subunit